MNDDADDPASGLARANQRHHASPDRRGEVGPCGHHGREVGVYGLG